MKRLILFMLCFTLCFSAFAQEIDSDYVFRASQAGDQYVKMNLSLNIPNKPSQLKIGGAGTLGYHYFVTDSINIGGDIGFNYLTTIGENVFYFIPFFFKVNVISRVAGLSPIIILFVFPSLIALSIP